MKAIKSVERAQPLTGPLLRAARGLLNISAAELGELANVSVATVRRAEACPGPVSIHQHSANRLRGALEGQGITFLMADAHGGEGVRFQAKH